MPRHPCISTGRNRGFTLVEALVALAVFSVVLVPFFTLAFQRRQSARARDVLVATCLLEQECARIKIAPNAAPATRLRSVNGLAWQIRIDVIGGELKHWRIEAFTKGAPVARIHTMTYAPAAR